MSVSGAQICDVDIPDRERLRTGEHPLTSQSFCGGLVASEGGDHFLRPGQLAGAIILGDQQPPSLGFQAKGQAKLAAGCAQDELLPSENFKVLQPLASLAQELHLVQGMRPVRPRLQRVVGEIDPSALL